MRVVAACLTGLLGFGALSTMVACSDSTDTGSAGAGGSGSGLAGAGGKSGSGGGSAQCGFTTVACDQCFAAQCGAEYSACSGDDACRQGLSALPGCACAPAADPQACQDTFVSEGGDLAQEMSDCFTSNCGDVCQ
jgi:hypothetical protein